MINNKKKIALIMALGLVFTGCGKDKDKNENTKPAITEENVDVDKEESKEKDVKKELTIEDTVKDADTKEKDINVVEWDNTGNTWETDNFKLEIQKTGNADIKDEDLSAIGVKREEYPNIYSVEYAYLANEELGDDYFIDPIAVKDDKGNEGLVLFVDQSLEKTGSGISQKHTTLTVGFKEKPGSIQMVFKDEDGNKKTIPVEIK